MKVLIAEDEVYSRRSLMKQVRGFDSRFEILEAANGRQAWELFQKHRPALILSDIKMPFVSGLQLLKMIREQDGEAKVILISGYAEFQYAQEALNAGAAGYLLKPLGDEALYDCLRRNLQQSSHQKQLEQELELLKSSDGLAKYIHDGLDSGVIREDYINESLFTHMLSPYQVAVLLSASGHYLESAQLQQLLGELFGSEPRFEYRVVMLSRRKWVIVYHSHPLADQALRRLSDALQERGWNGWIGVSDCQEQVQALNQTYEQADSVLRYRLLDGTSRLFCYRQQKEKRTVQDLPFDLEGKLRCYLEQHNAAGACELVRRELALLQANQRSSFACCDHFLLQLTNLFQRVTERLSPRPSLSELTVHIDSCESMEDLTAAVCRVITCVCSRLENASGSDESSIVDRVLAHINQNYNKDISLKELAENVFFMNHTYLSHLIREKTGKNYSSYLRELRIRHARELLSDPNLSITDVASFSGYNDSSQFIQVFKKEVGVTPKKYQEMLRNGSDRKLSGKEHQE